MKQLIGALAAGLLLSLSVSAFANPWRTLYGDTLVFDVFREGQWVGYYETRFVGNGPRWRVEVQLELEVPWVFWRYRYQYQGVETWEEDTMTGLTVRIDNDGKVREHNFSRDGEVLRSETGVEAGLSVLTSHHYDIAVVEHDRVINTLTGRVENIRVEKSGPEPFFAAGTTLPAVRYRYLGDETTPPEQDRMAGTRAWYDLEGRWVGLKFIDARGGEVELRCRRCGLERK